MENNEKKGLPFPFTSTNYRFMVVGVLIILAGLVIMSLDNEPHGFGFLGLTLGPMVTLGGFMFEIFAILYKKKA